MNVRRSLAFVVALLIAAPLAAQQTPAQKAAEDAEFLKGAHVAGVAGVTFPVVLTEVKPRYTADAMREKLQGQVEVQAVVGADGKVERARVIQSLDKVLWTRQCRPRSCEGVGVQARHEGRPARARGREPDARLPAALSRRRFRARAITR